MLDWLFILLLVFAVIILLIVVTNDFGVFWNTVFIMIDIMVWYLLSASVMVIEIPYEIYNVSSSQIETGYHTFTSPISPYLVYFFMMFAVIMMIYFVGYILGPAIYKRWMR